MQQLENDQFITSLCFCIPDCKNRKCDFLLQPTQTTHTHTNEATIAPKRHIVTKGACCRLAGWPDGYTGGPITQRRQSDPSRNLELMWRRAPSMAADAHCSTGDTGNRLETARSLTSICPSSEMKGSCRTKHGVTRKMHRNHAASVHC